MTTARKSLNLTEQQCPKPFSSGEFPFIKAYFIEQNNRRTDLQSCSNFIVGDMYAAETSSFLSFQIINKRTNNMDKRYEDTHSPTQTSLNPLPLSFPDNSGEVKKANVEINKR